MSRNEGATARAWSSVTDEASARKPVTGHLVSYSILAPGISADNFLAQARGNPRFFWQKGGSDVLYAGFGTAVQLMAWGENRFLEIEQKAASLFDSAKILGEHAAPILPRLFGGFSFRDDFAAENIWTAFHPAHFVLPHYQLVQDGEAGWLTINTLVSETEDLADLSVQLQRALQARYETLLATAPAGGSSAVQGGYEIRYPMSPSAWADLVERAVQEMRTTALKKVVLARVSEIRSSARVDICAALRFLNQRYQDCTRFLFEPRPYHAFYGATPELLAALEGRRLLTMALAGSVSRGKTAVEDAALAQELMNSAKDRLEHDLVVRAIQRRLDPITSELTFPSVPETYQLSYIQHLLTPVSGILDKPSGILPLVRLLHPTPAMGGSPRNLALSFIREQEPVPRGWYAAPVGWLDSHMDGEFVVAIRSAVVQERRAWCYSGAGIVPESKAAVEWAETDLKFRPMLQALGLNPIPDP